MYTIVPIDPDSRVLLEIIELKWMLAGEGTRLHVERLQNDAAYARDVLARAQASGNAALRECAATLRQHLGLDEDCPSRDAPRGPA